MKKNVLALSITAALFGLTGGAQAMTGALGGATALTSLALNGDGIGHSLIIPYFTAQDNNSTKINLVNTDQVNGKAVKVRFRGAANSDDIFDFQVFLSPGDVWTASIGKAASGLAQLTTSDASCTKPAASVLNSTPFVTSRLDPSMTAAQLANGTREGYVEIFNMGDIPPGVAAAIAVADLPGTATAGVDTGTANPLFTAIKHVNKVAPCTATSSVLGNVWTYLDTTQLVWNLAASATSPRSAGLLPPTTGLMANWTVINTVGAAAWSGEATAVQSILTATGVASTGNVVYWPQTGTAVATPDTYTADPLLRSANVYANQGATNGTFVADATPPVTAGNYDLPDVSTPYSAAAAASPLSQARTMTAAIAASAATSEFLTDTSITASTDWVFSMPTRRYNVSLDYAAIGASDNGKRFTDINGRFAVTAANQAAAAAAAAILAAGDTVANAQLGYAAAAGAANAAAADAAVVVAVAGANGVAGGAAANTAWTANTATTIDLGYFLANNTSTVTDTSAAGTNGNGRQICVTGITTKVFDREESTSSSSTAVVVSPSTPAAPLSFCGEAAVLSFNNGGIVANGTGALKASVAVKDLDVTYRDGWMRIATPSASGLPYGFAVAATVASGVRGLPVLGAQFSRAFAGTNSFGATYNHRFTR